MENYEQIVLDWLDNHDTTPLHFGDKPEFIVEILPKGSSLEENVRTVLEFNEEWDTYDSDGELQCEFKRSRSALDIWRLLQYYFPGTPFFKLMNLLYDLAVNRGEFYHLNCPGVGRMVFKAEPDDTPLRDVETEFEFPFYIWEKIGE